MNCIMIYFPLYVLNTMILLLGMNFFAWPLMLLSEKKPWMDHLKIIQKLAAEPGSSAKIFKAIADPPTTSLQRLKVKWLHKHMILFKTRLLDLSTILLCTFTCILNQYLILLIQDILGCLVMLRIGIWMKCSELEIKSFWNTVLRLHLYICFL